MKLPKLPDGYVLVRGRRGVIGCRTADAEALREAGFGPDGTRDTERLVDAEEAGREPLGLLEIGGVTCLARRFTHGGLARVLTGARFKDPARPFAELVLSEHLRERGIRTPRVVAARAVRVAPVGYELTIVTERLVGVRDLGWYLGDVRSGDTSPRNLQRALEAAARLIAELHRVGFIHADLQPANLLIDPADPSAPARAIDLDRSRFISDAGREVEPLPECLAVRNLGRLWRHVARREAEYGAVLSRFDRVRFLRAYGVPRGDLARLSRAIQLGAESRGIGHRIGWWIERHLGRGKDRRAAGARSTP